MHYNRSVLLMTSFLVTSVNKTIAEICAVIQKLAKKKIFHGKIQANGCWNMWRGLKPTRLIFFLNSRISKISCKKFGSCELLIHMASSD